MSCSLTVQQRAGEERFRLYASVKDTRIALFKTSGYYYLSREEAQRDMELFEWFWLPKQPGHPAKPHRWDWATHKPEGATWDSIRAHLINEQRANTSSSTSSTSSSSSSGSSNSSSGISDSSGRSGTTHGKRPTTGTHVSLGKKQY
jgi:hypothetical protein